MEQDNRKVLLQINNVSFSYGTKEILKDFSLTLHEGEIMGLSGGNGSGKSTALKLVAGYMDGHTGDISFSSDALIKDMAAIIDMPYIYEDMSVGDNLRMMEILRDEPYDAGLAEALGIMAYKSKKASKLSLGNRQKLALCMSIYESTRIALLDEPFNGLDIMSKAALTKVLKKKADKGMGLVITSHIRGDLEQICDSITEMG